VKPYYEHNGITIYHGDCREILPVLQFDAIICDPPYGRDVALSRRGGQSIVGDHDTSLRDWIASLPFPKLLFGSPFVSGPPCDAVLIWDKSELTGMGDLSWQIMKAEVGQAPTQEP